MIIELNKLWKILIRSKRYVVYIIMMGVFFGLASSFLIIPQYTSSVILLPSYEEESKMQNFGDLASLAGLDLGNNSMSVSPELYGDIVVSTPFLVSLINVEIQFDELDAELNCYRYFSEIYIEKWQNKLRSYTIALPYRILSNGNSKNLKERIDVDLHNKELTYGDKLLLNNLKSRISVEYDQKKGTITISTVMPDYVASSHLSKTAVTLLMDYLTNYNTQKAKEELNFIEARYNIARDRFEKSQESLALVLDRNRNLITSKAKIELNKAQNEYDISFEIYNQLAKTFEEAKLKVERKTPSFTIIEPPVMLNKKSSPSRFRSCIVGVAFFFSVYILFILYKNRDELIQYES